MNGSSAAASTRSLDLFDSQVNETFFPMECSPPRSAIGEFRGLLTSRQLGKVGFAAVRSSPLDVYRRRTHISRVSDAVYLVKVQVEGESRVLQRGNEACLQPGDFALCLSSEPYELHFPEDYSQVVLAIPEGVMLECVHRPDRHLGVRMQSTVGANGLFAQFVTSIAHRLDSLDGVLAQRLEANVIDLLTTTLGYAEESQRHDLLGCGVKLEYLHRIRGFIRKHLHDERLTPTGLRPHTVFPPATCICCSRRRMFPCRAISSGCVCRAAAIRWKIRPLPNTPSVKSATATASRTPPISAAHSRPNSA
ncbi:hypothetical protein G3T16_03355 [Kineobactrum salinum]|uniref:Transcription regulator HTH AraC- type ligand binding domain-containing protein n=1 Tax=Kineobactrum salinum TaxID=2708301 RepID=A0A6C0TYX9_9GAMM|nr:hypothetical protein [Kineobactrum salinum]QIB64579.1 hypothetical protein G3T16_03355 [Kineobactrum salinum]